MPVLAVKAPLGVWGAFVLDTIKKRSCPLYASGFAHGEVGAGVVLPTIKGARGCLLLSLYAIIDSMKRQNFQASAFQALSLTNGNEEIKCLWALLSLLPITAPLSMPMSAHHSYPT